MLKVLMALMLIAPLLIFIFIKQVVSFIASMGDIGILFLAAFLISYIILFHAFLYVVQQPLDVKVPVEVAKRKPTVRSYASWGFIWEHGFLRVEVKNRGIMTAKECTAQVRITRRPVKDDEECKTPSPEYNRYVDITWDDGKTRRTISPGTSAAVNVVFIPLSLNRNFNGIPWDGKEKWGNIIAFIATRDIIGFLEERGFPERAELALRLPDRVQGGLVRGEYEVEVMISPENRESVRKGFRIRIDDWERMDIEEL